MTFFGFQNQVMTGELAGGGSGLDNLTSRIGTDRWFAGLDVAGGAYITIDTGSAETKWRTVAAFQTNFTGTCEMVVKLGTSLDDDDVYSGAVVSGAVPGRNYLIDLFPQEYSARYLRVEFTDTANPDGFLLIGFIYAGAITEITHGLSIDSALGLDVSTTESRTLGGQEYPIANFEQFTWDIAFDAVENSEVNTLIMPLSRYAAGGENVLMIPFSDGSELLTQSVYGRPKNGVHITSRAGIDLKIWKFSLSDRL